MAKISIGDLEKIRDGYDDLRFDYVQLGRINVDYETWKAEIENEMRQKHPDWNKLQRNSFAERVWRTFSISDGNGYFIPKLSELSELDKKILKAIEDSIDRDPGDPGDGGGGDGGSGAAEKELKEADKTEPSMNLQQRLEDIQRRMTPERRRMPNEKEVYLEK